MATTQPTTDTSKNSSGKRFSIFRILFVALVVLGIAIAVTLLGGYYQWSVRSLPQIDGEIHLSGLKGEVSVRRDKWGVPYITASNEEDLMFAQGYVMAQDRLWQMDMFRRAASGRLSEILGAVQLEFDKRQRQYGFRRVVQRSLKTLPPNLIVMLNAYAEGVNTYINEHRDDLPLEFHILQYEPEPWKPADSLITGKLMSEMLSSSWEVDQFRGKVFPRLDEETRRYLYAEYTPDDQLLVGNGNNAAESQSSGTQQHQENRGPARKNLSPAGPPSPVATIRNLEKEMFAELGLDTEIAGSNNWVISGKKTTTGKPILANDPHLGHGIPSIWYQIELATKD